jgi:predicted O-methyltransferase YrrM
MRHSLDEEPLRSLLQRLHGLSLSQEVLTRTFIANGGHKTIIGSEESIAAGRTFWRDKFVALDADKARFCYQLCRSIDARAVVEAGTSFGVSTLYLAAAVRDNGGGQVIGTEWESEKAAIARAHLSEAGLGAFVDVREGDLRETLRHSMPSAIDLLLLDIWTPMARPAIEIVAPRMRYGAVVLTDNTLKRRTEYSDLFAFLGDPSTGFITQTLPFDGGLEFSVKVRGHSLGRAQLEAESVRA